MHVGFRFTILYFCTLMHICYCNFTHQDHFSDFSTSSTEYSPNVNNYTEYINVYRTNTKGETELYFRVIQGHRVVLGEIPYQVALMQKGNKDTYVSACGGTIVRRDKVVSAAHCVVDLDDIEILNIVAGQIWRVTYFEVDGQWRKAKRIIYPREYKFPNADISVIELNHPFVFDTAVQPVPFATEFADYDKVCVTSGYGKTSKTFKDDENWSDQLLAAELKILPISMCNRIHGKKMNRFICTSDEFADVSKGDSGGPLVCADTEDPADDGRGILVGIVCSGRHKPLRTLFTRVSEFKTLITGESASSNVFVDIILFCQLVLVNLYSLIKNL